MGARRVEREITQTRERLASLNAQAVKLRARIGKRDSGGGDGRTPVTKAQSEAAPPPDVQGSAGTDFQRDEEAVGRAQEGPFVGRGLTAVARARARWRARTPAWPATMSSTAIPSDLKIGIDSQTRGGDVARQPTRPAPRRCDSGREGPLGDRQHTRRRLSARAATRESTNRRTGRMSAASISRPIGLARADGRRCGAGRLQVRAGGGAGRSELVT